MKFTAAAYTVKRNVQRRYPKHDRRRGCAVLARIFRQPFSQGLPQL